MWHFLAKLFIWILNLSSNFRVDYVQLATLTTIHPMKSTLSTHKQFMQLETWSSMIFFTQSEKLYNNILLCHVSMEMHPSFSLLFLLRNTLSCENCCTFVSRLWASESNKVVTKPFSNVSIRHLFRRHYHPRGFIILYTWYVPLSPLF